MFVQAAILSEQQFENERRVKFSTHYKDREGVRRRSLLAKSEVR